MKAAIYKAYGPAEKVLRVEEVSKPSPGKGEILVKVHYTTVNRTDCAVVTAKPFIMRFFIGLFAPKRNTPGTDFAGQVEAIGEGVENFEVGARVFGFQDEGFQSQQQYVVLKTTEAILEIPKAFSYREAAASIEGPHYAINGINKIDLRPGQQVLVNGASGAIGSATVQLLKDRGVMVTAVCGTENVERIKALGADVVIDYKKEDFTQLNQRFDFVLDTVGKSSFGKCKPLLKERGVYTSSELGWMAQNLFYALAHKFFGKKKVIFPLPTNPLASLKFISELAEKGAYKPLIDRTYPLDEIAEAYTYVGKGQKVGNVLIEMW